jgi:cysteine sulfinate desulfinase/cysteine desulfurase-like protein
MRLMWLDAVGVSVSTGDACSSSKAGQPSRVLQAMGFDALRAIGKNIHFFPSSAFVLNNELNA